VSSTAFSRGLTRIPAWPLKSFKIEADRHSFGKSLDRKKKHSSRGLANSMTQEEIESFLSGLPSVVMC
jgi:hypothetical protein